VLSCENKAEGFHLLNSFGDLDESVVQKITTSPLFRDIIDLEKGQIINDLASDDRWPNTCPDLKILLIMPLVAHDQCSGALILGSGNENDLFSAGDLKQATAMAAIAAEILYNAHLFQEVVEARNYNENILENLSNGVITLDLALCVTKANAAARRILQQDEQKLLGTAIGDLFTGENTWIAEPFNQNSIGKRGIYWTDRDLKIGDAEGVTVNLSAVPLENVEHRQIGFMLILEDITREKRIKGTMARFMSERVVEKVMDAGESVLGGAAQDATVLFSDIRNFTGLSEDLNPKQMVETLNSYFTDMVDVIFERGGTLDKFIGDAIMAVFGAPFVTPDDPDNAAHAAIEMMLRLEAFNRLQDNRIGPVLDMGIGINSGTVVAGTIGSPRRMDYTVIGDQVNLASRIEAANKYYGTKILVSEHTAKRFRKSYSMREVDLVKVAGRQAPTALFEILDYHSENTFPEMDSVLEAYGKGLHHYRHREWVQGAKYFTAALRANPNDRATQIFLHRCWTHAARPPDDNWSSVTDLART
ncbi:MAG: adenylate/guanylate cyclase domain-containing protein, partial [Pseudomonadota bacterium]